MTARIVEFSRDVLGFALYPRQAEILAAIYAERIRTAVLRLGRRAGKGRIASVVATYEATVNAGAHLAHVPAGERVAVVCASTSREQSRIVHRYVRSFMQVPALRSLVKRSNDDEIELTNGMVVLTVPAYAASIRGLAAAVVILDEAAHFTGRDGSPLDPSSVWDALIPSTAQFPERRVIVTSTPRWSIGWWYDLVELAASGTHADMREWHVSTADMNPTIEHAFLAAERAKDPDAFRREYEAEWDSGTGAIFDEALVRAAIRETGELAPEARVTRYVVAVDAAFTADAFAVLVGHRELDGRITVDRVAGLKGSRSNPVSVDGALSLIADLAISYHGAEVVIDQYAAQPIRQGLKSRGVTVREVPWTAERKLEAATTMRRVLYAGLLSLPDHSDLVAELVRLEQRPLPSGRLQIRAPGSEHDDYATAALALVTALERPSSIAQSRSYADLPGAPVPVIRRGGLVLRGKRYIDRPTNPAAWS